MADAPQQRHQLVPDLLQRQRQAVCRGRGRRRIEPFQGARHADSRDTEPRRWFGAMGVCAAELMSREQSWCERSNPQPRFSLPIQSNSAFAEFDMFGAEIGRTRFRMEGGV